ncbi:MAG: hypothetical protein IJ748_02940 [Bacteroidales bacterium]|nr:hypothetical protein [Bacteroidales bacterium]
MKNLKVIFLVALLFNVFNTFSQEKTNHLKFKGVEINGTLDSFTSKMKKKGFTFIGEQGGIAMLNGDFAGYRDCTLYVFTNTEGNVSSIGIYFPKVKSWMELYSNYRYIKELLMKKYGAPNFFK